MPPPLPPPNFFATCEGRVARRSGSVAGSTPRGTGQNRGTNHVSAVGNSSGMSISGRVLGRPRMLAAAVQRTARPSQACPAEARLARNAVVEAGRTVAAHVGGRGGIVLLAQPLGPAKAELGIALLPFLGLVAWGEALPGATLGLPTAAAAALKTFQLRIHVQLPRETLRRRRTGCVRDGGTMSGQGGASLATPENPRQASNAVHSIVVGACRWHALVAGAGVCAGPAPRAPSSRAACEAWRCW